MMLAQFHFKPGGSPGEPPGFVCLGVCPRPLRSAPLPSCRCRNMQIGNHIFTRISFVTPVGVQESLSGRNEDGLLPTPLFRRVLISGRGHYAVFDPK